MGFWRKLHLSMWTIFRATLANSRGWLTTTLNESRQICKKRLITPKLWLDACPCGSRKTSPKSRLSWRRSSTKWRSCQPLNGFRSTESSTLSHSRRTQRSWKTSTSWMRAWCPRKIKTLKRSAMTRCSVDWQTPGHLSLKSYLSAAPNPAISSCGHLRCS